MKKKRKWIIIVFIVILLGGIAFGYQEYRRRKENEQVLVENGFALDTNGNLVYIDTDKTGPNITIPNEVKGRKVTSLHLADEFDDYIEPKYRKTKFEAIKSMHFEKGNQIDRIITGEIGAGHMINLESIDIRDSVNLESLYIDNTKITSINLDGVKKIKRISITNTENFESINVSMCKELININLKETSIKEIDISENLKLESFQCANSQLNTINTRENKKLVELALDNNQLTTLDLSRNKNLKYLSCAGNHIKRLDIKNNLKLTKDLIGKEQKRDGSYLNIDESVEIIK